MRSTTRLLIALSLLSLGLTQATPEKKIVDGITYHILRTPADSIHILWKDSEENQLRTIPETAKYLAGLNLEVETIINGGIFEPGGIPSGLLIQNARELVPVNRKDGHGNFFLKPNGIFLISREGAAILATNEYPPKGGKPIRCAVQSGPLLLRNAKIHPAFNANSANRLHRNGVGVDKQGMVVFAITDFHSPKFPNLHEFSQLFLSLGCNDALFLDGDISQMRSGADLDRPSNRFGSLIAVTKPVKSPPATQPNSDKK